MWPKICQIGPLTIYSYGLMLALAYFVAAHLSAQEASRQGLPKEKVFNFTFLVFITGILGARAFYVISNFSYYAGDLKEILMFNHGGLSWFGGFFVGFGSGIWYIKKNKLPFYKLMDCLMPYVALGQAIGRIGCYLNDCCFGKAELLIPTQILSSMTALSIFMILRITQTRPHKVGQILYLYMFLYSIKRFFIEFVRIDNPDVFLGLTLFQLISIGMFVFASYKLLRLKFNKLPVASDK